MKINLIKFAGIYIDLRLKIDFATIELYYYLVYTVMN